MADKRRKRVEDFIAPFRVKPGSNVTLSKDYDPSFREGVKNKKGEVLMPSFKSKLTPEQIKALAGYVRTFHKK